MPARTMFVLALPPLTDVIVGMVGRDDGVPMYKYSTFALQQSPNAISTPAPAVHVEKVAELENAPAEETVPFQVLSP